MLIMLPKFPTLQKVGQHPYLSSRGPRADRPQDKQLTEKTRPLQTLKFLNFPVFPYVTFMTTMSLGSCALFSVSFLNPHQPTTDNTVAPTGA